MTPSLAPRLGYVFQLNRPGLVPAPSATNIAANLFLRADGTWQAAGSSSTGIPTGGSTGEVLTKDSNTDYDVSWQPVSGGSGVTAVTASLPLSSSGGATPNISITQASGASDGYLSAANWTTFNNKQPAGAYLTGVTADAPLSGAGTSGSHLVISQAGIGTAGYLSSADWNTFNNKQAAGNYITALTGDISASGPGSVAATLATVNGNVGSFGSATQASTFTVNGKGLITAAGQVTVTPAWASITSTPTTLAGYGITDGASNGAITGSGLTMATARLLGRTTGGTGAVEEIAVGTGLSLAAGTLSCTVVGTVTSVTASLPILSSGGATPDISIPVATGSADGYLSSTDWTTFNNKQPAGAYLTAVTADAPLSGAGTSGSHLVIAQSTTSTDGYLSSTDWNTFNGKQAAGNYITALTGDVTASGPGSVGATLATVNANVGTFGSSTSIPTFTVNAKGLITAASGNAVVAPAGTLTGATLAANVLASSLTSVGTLTGGATGAGFTVALGSSTITGDLALSNFTQASAASILLGRGSAGGAGDYQEVTLGAGITMTGTVLSATGSGGTVTSVSFTGGLISVATATTTPALTVAGTSGGIPYFSGAATWASSAALAANALVIGGGAGVAPATTTTGTGVLTALGINVGSAGAFVTFNGAGGTPSSMTGTNITGTASGLTAGNVTTNANLTGPITSVGNATSIASQTGTGTTFVMNTAPTIAGGSITALTALAVRSTGAAFDLTLASSEVLTGGKTLSFVLGDTNRTLTIGASASVSGSNTGDQTITLTGAVTGSGTGSFATTIATPGTLTVSSTNSTVTAHTHAITSSSAPGAAASLLATDSSGIIGSTGTRIVKGWFTDLTVTNAIAGSVTGSAATATTAANLSISGQTGLLSFTGLTSTNRIKTVRDAADTILELGGSYTPSGTWTNMTLVTPALGTPSSGTVTNLTGTASININGTVGATTPTTGVFTTGVFGSTTSLLLGTAGSAVGNIGFRNATSGTATLAPPTGALGTYTVTLPNATSTLPVATQQITYAGLTAARTKTYRDANDTILELGGSYTPTGTWTSMTLVTPALGTPASGVVTNLTGTASININGTVGATTPAAGSFTTITGAGLIQNTIASSGEAVSLRNSQAATGVYVKFSYNTSTVTGYIGTADTILTGGAVADFALNAATGSVLIGVNAATVGKFTTTGLNATVIGATTPAAGSFTTITGSGLVDISGASAGQIKFPATQNASANVNTLDDYEEGTWTPSVGGTATYTAQDGVYTKIGRQVTVICHLTINAIGTGSTTKISGLPFTNSAKLSAGSVAYFSSLATNVIALYCYVDASAATIGFANMNTAGVNITNVTPLLGSSTDIYLTATYFV